MRSGRCRGENKESESNKKAKHEKETFFQTLFIAKCANVSLNSVGDIYVSNMYYCFTLQCSVFFLIVLQTIMEAKAENRKSVNGQLIYVPHKDTIRLLEVYVQRSLSLNDSEYDEKKPKRKEKWVTNPRKKRLHSSDSSIHIPELSKNLEIGPFTAFKSSLSSPEKIDEESQKPVKKSKKNKKASFWKNLLSFFTLKNEDRSEEEDDPPEIPDVAQPERTSDSVAPQLPNTPNTSQKKKMLRKKPMRKRFSKQRLSLTKLNRSGKEHAEITRVDCKLCDVRLFFGIYSKGATDWIPCFSIQLLSAWNRHTRTTRK